MARKAQQAPVVLPFLFLTFMGLLAIFAYDKYELHYILANIGAVIFILPFITFWGFLFLRTNWKENWFLATLWSVLLFGMPVVGYNYLTHQLPENFPPKAGLRVATYNVDYYNKSEYNILDRIKYIKKLNADVVSLVEVNNVWENQLKELSEMYPYIVKVEETRKGGNVGLTVLLSKYGIEKTKSFDEAYSASHSLVLNEEHSIEIVQTHPMPPINQPLVDKRANSYEILTDEPFSENMIMLGDFNHVPWQAEMKNMMAAHNLENMSDNWPTWPRIFPVSPIDHVLASKPMHGSDSGRLCMKGSDHCLVYADIINYAKQ